MLGRTTLGRSRALDHDGVERGPPEASTRRERFTPFLPLSVELAPTRSPQNGPFPMLHRIAFPAVSYWCQKVVDYA